MKAVIPCAVKKDSMFPFSETKPTGLMPVMGKPLTRHIVEDLRAIGVDEFFIVANHMKEDFEEEYAEDDDVQVVVQEELNGTAGALEACGDIEEDFFVVNGDVAVSQRDLENLRKKFEQTDSKASVLAAGEDNPEKFGVLSITNDQVNSLEEKPENPDNVLVNTGIYAFRPEIMDVVKNLEGEEKALTDAVREFIDEDEATFELIEDYWIDVGGPKKLLKADQVKREYEINDVEIREGADVHEEASVLGNAIIDEGAVLKPGAVLEGDVYIGENARVGPNAHVKNSSVSANNVVACDSVIDSIVFEDGIMDSGVSVESCIFAEECDLRSGSVIRESFIGARSYIEMNNSIRGVKFVPDARTDLSEISK
ncbi:sugar phosphate nucleotidyltransferase [Candidatus Nanosalina sp. VS9-1]|uniref:sugar phosphate nucleotidyltransferase n=1 Tax=Candidatus Nanosalina sp. VS9-1 TaxID=3388566 RepID=UPI0039DFAD70